MLNEKLKWLVIAGTVLLTLYFTRYINNSVNLRLNPERRLHLVVSYLLGAAIFAFSAWRSDQQIAQTSLYAAAGTCLILGLYSAIRQIKPSNEDSEINNPLDYDAESELELRLKRASEQNTELLSKEQ